MSRMRQRRALRHAGDLPFWSSWACRARARPRLRRCSPSFCTGGSRMPMSALHQGCTVIENEQYEVELAQAARKIAQRAREMAEAERITLTGTKWHRGHEVADLDN